jgi:hypothetical protein
MRQLRGGRALVVALLLVSCGGSGGKTGTGGTGGGRAGSGGAGGSGSGGGGSTGGADGGVNCNAVTTACGGNVVGTWRITQTCLSVSRDLSSTCPGATAIYDYTLGGTATYNTDGTYSSAGTVSALVHEHFPSGCMPFGFTCAQLGQTAMDAGTGGCATDSQGGCNCDGVTPVTSGAATGTYKASGGTLTTMHDGTTSLASYCVQGNLLYQSFEEQPDGGTAAIGIVVSTKK